MAHPWSRGTAAYLGVGEQGTVRGQAQCSAVCKGEAHPCEPFLCVVVMVSLVLCPPVGCWACSQPWQGRTWPRADGDGAGPDGAASSPMLVVLVPVPGWCPAQTMLVLALAVQCNAPVPCWWC